MNTLSSIIKELEGIRERVGAKPVKFSFDPIKINDDLTSVAEVEALFDPSGFLMSRGVPVFVYIRDHTVKGYSGPEDANKIHFSQCRTLRQMKQQGRFEIRYRVTNRDDNRYLIDTNRWYGSSKEREEKLYPCQNCLAKVSYQCFHWQMDPSEKQKVVKHFDAKVAFALIGQQFDLFRKDVERSGLSSANLPAGYPHSWAKISREYRRLKNYTCEQCGVRLPHAPGCLDLHHKDSDKQNIRDSNLMCLCKCCHADWHKHYHVRYDCKDLIKEARRNA